MISLSIDTFDELKTFMDLCISQRKDESERVKEMDTLRIESKS